jgi:hypothetical protein
MPKRGEGATGKNWTLLRSQSAATRKRIASLLQEAETISEIPEADAISAWQALHGELDEWHKEAGRWLERASALLKRADASRGEQLETLPQRISQRLKSSGHTVFGDADLLIVDGIAHLELSPGNGKIALNQSSIESFDPDVIAIAVSDEITKLRKAATEPGLMLTRLLEAYDREVRANDLRPGAPVQTTSVLTQLTFLRQTNAFRTNPSARLFKEYPHEVFRADLYALLSSGRLTLNNRKFRYASGADTSGAVFMLVPALERPAHVGRVWFEDEGQTE